MTSMTNVNGPQEIVNAEHCEGHILYPCRAAAPGNKYNAEFFNSTKSVRSVLIDGVELSAGDRVCIRPSRPMDAMDLILAGKTAVIETLEQDGKGQIHLGLALEGDSQGYLDAVRQSGYRFFYPADEVGPCKREVAS